MANTPLITPADLYRNSVLNRALGSINDPYNLAKSIGTLSTAYGDLNREVQQGAQSFDTLSRSLASEAAGLPAAVAGRDVAAANLGKDTAQRTLRNRQVLEEAFQYAL